LQQDSKIAGPFTDFRPENGPNFFLFFSAHSYTEKSSELEAFKRLFYSNLSIHKRSTSYPQSLKSAWFRTFWIFRFVSFICTLDADQGRKFLPAPSKPSQFYRGSYR